VFLIGLTVIDGLRPDRSRIQRPYVVTSVHWLQKSQDGNGSNPRWRPALNQDEKCRTQGLNSWILLHNKSSVGTFLIEYNKCLHSVFKMLFFVGFIQTNIVSDSARVKCMTEQGTSPPIQNQGGSECCALIISIYLIKFRDESNSLKLASKVRIGGVFSWFES